MKSSSIMFFVGALSGLKHNLEPLIEKTFLFNDVKKRKRITDFFDALRSDLYVSVEYPYVDVLYRDSFYNYYSSKFSEYQRDCIRIAFFSQSVEKDDFFNSDKRETLQKVYSGFLILRPVQGKFIGRSVISPEIIKANNFLSCTVEYGIHIMGIPFVCSGFPHASQTSETISCAETSVWSIMEYFGSKYKEYEPVLPSRILKSLSRHSHVRLLPSDGLTINQISHCLKDFGFSTKLYAKDKFKDDFKSLLYCYIESGIPVIIGLQNKKHAHAVVCTGHKYQETYSFEASSPLVIDPDLKIHDSASINNNFVVIDDNQPPFQIAPFESPTIYYSNESFEKMHIKYFVVPLYKRIYLEAFKARRLLFSILKSPQIGIMKSSPDNEEYVLRFFLTSQRSFKKEISEYCKMHNDMKKYLVNMTMPRFIWVAEIAKKDDFLKKEAESMIILDATGADDLESICFLYYKKYILDLKNTEFKNMAWFNFEMYQNNLKGDWIR